MITLPNRNLLSNLRSRIETEKRAFVPAGDPSAMGGGGGGGAPPMDPAMMGGGGGGAPPMDPAMMDPSMIGAMGGGGAPPAPPPSGGMDDATINKIVEAVAAKMGGGMGGAGGGAAGGAAIKPKIDVNVELLKLSKNIARIMDHLQIPVSAADQVVTSDDLMNMANQSQGQPPSAAGGIQPMPAMAPMGGGAPPAPAGGGGEKKGFDYGHPVSPVSVTDLQKSREAISAGRSVVAALKKLYN